MLHERLRQADDILTSLERACAAGYRVTCDATGVEITHPAHDPTVLVGRDIRDRLAHGLEPISLELQLAAEERRDICNRLVSDAEPLHSPERDTREPELYP